MTSQRSFRKSSASAAPRTHLPALLLALVAATSAACGGGTAPDGCSDQAPCPAGQRCVAAACVAAECAAGQTRPCGPQPVGACRQGTQACVGGAFEAACTGQVLPSTEGCDAGQVDEDCDGAANEGCGCAPVGARSACCGGRGEQVCVAAGAGSELSACSVEPKVEVCNAIDDDCDGLVDEEEPPLCGAGASCLEGACGCAAGAAPLKCLVDGDGDGWTADLSTGSELCPAADRPKFGECPVGWVAPGFEGGLDCDDAAAARFALQAVRADQDGDGACAGPPSELCTDGVAAPAGLRLAQQCRAEDDCDDASAAAFTLASLRADADGDAYCAGATTPRCVGASTPAGLRAPAQCQPSDDCDDANAATFVTASVRADADGDTYCAGATALACIGAAPPSGLRLAAACAGDDCQDGNPLATTVCLLPAAFVTTSAVKTCAFVPPTESFTVSSQAICPFGFVVDGASLRSQRLAGTGSCTATGLLTLTATCNGLDGATCRNVADCVAQ